MLNKPKTLSTKKPLHRTIFTRVFSTQKTFDTEKHVHTDCTQIVLQTDFFCRQTFYPKQFLHNMSFCAQMPLKKHKKCTAVFRDRRFVHTESSPHRILTHRKFYAQHFCIQMLYTDVFTQTQIAHRNLCTQHAFTHSHLLRKEALLPLLDHLPFVFPLSSDTLLIKLRSCLNHCFIFCDNTGHWHERYRDILHGFQTSARFIEYCMFWKNTASL